MTINELRGLLEGMIERGYGEYKACSEAEAGCVMTDLLNEKPIINNIFRHVILRAN